MLETVRNLGILFDNKLYFPGHINEMVASSMRLLGFYLELVNVVTYYVVQYTYTFAQG